MSMLAAVPQDLGPLRSSVCSNVTSVVGNTAVITSGQLFSPMTQYSSRQNRKVCFKVPVCILLRRLSNYKIKPSFATSKNVFISRF
jgi:hypothetical protein